MSLLVLFAFLLVQDPDVNALLTQLSEGSIEERDGAFKALVEAGETADPLIKARFAAAKGEMRLRLLQILDHRAVPRPLRGLLPPVARVSIDVKDGSLKEILEDFQRQTRIPMRVKDAGDKRITVSFKELSQLQALDAICKAAKIGWYFRSYDFGGPLEIDEPPDPNIIVHPAPEMRFGPAGGYEEIPRLFIRQYLVELHEVDLTRSNDFRGGQSKAVLNFGMHWPAGVNPYVAQFEVKSVLDDLGHEILEGHDDRGEPKGPRREFSNILRLYHRYRIRYPDKGVRKLSSIRGEGRFYFILREKKVSFDSMDALIGARKEVEGVSAEFTGMATETPRAGPSYQKAQLRIKGRGNTFPPRIQARLENKKSTPVGAVPVGDPADGLYDVYLYSQDSKIVALDAVVETVCGEDAFDFEFKDIPLP